MDNDKNKTMPRLAYTVTDVAQMLSVSNKTVYRLVDRGLLKKSNALRHLRISAVSLNDFIKKTST